MHIRLDPKMRKSMSAIVKQQYFTNESEFIRDSIRKNLEIYEKIQLLASLRGSVARRKKPPGPVPSDVFREFGIVR